MTKFKVETDTKVGGRTRCVFDDDLDRFKGGRAYWLTDAQILALGELESKGGQRRPCQDVV